jgi:hypothetical protein
VSKRPGAVVTIVQDEPVFLPIWLRYYSRFYGQDDLYVLDHGSTDGSTDGPGFVRVPLSHPTHDVAWMRDMMQRQQHELLERYRTVICVDVDEIVAPDPTQGTLADYVSRFDEEFVNCRGHEVIHVPNAEPPIDPRNGVLRQRSHWFANPVYSKPVLASAPMVWGGGLHSRVDGQVNEDPGLALIHLHRMDFELCLARHKQQSSRPWNKADLDYGWGYQNRITELGDFTTWFFEDSCGGGPVEIERIPEHWRDVV